jgi:amidohydrolase
MGQLAEDAIRSEVARLAPDFVATRHHLHQNPELSDREANTSALVAERLRSFGIEDVRVNVGGYGVVGTLHGTSAGRTIALRADMDALPIQETADLPYRSCVPGVMHACGHDGHTATLLGAAATLARMRERLAGSVRFIFQPSEETVGGAARMCRDGVMDGVDAIVALHGWPGMAVGQIGVRPGPMMASSDTFDITIRGKGAHAAYPHMSVDSILVGSQLVVALQSVVSRETSPTESAVVTVAQFHAGTAYNIIPGSAEIKGTVRCLSKEIQDGMPARLERITGGICAAAGAGYEFRYQNGTPVTVNDCAVNSLVEEVGAEVLGERNVVPLNAPSMGAEDFAMYLAHAPGAMFRLGVGEEMTALHTPTYNFADGAVGVGMELFTRLAVRYLSA